MALGFTHLCCFSSNKSNWGKLFPPLFCTDFNKIRFWFFCGWTLHNTSICCTVWGKWESSNMKRQNYRNKTIFFEKGISFNCNYFSIIYQLVNNLHDVNIWLIIAKLYICFQLNFRFHHSFLRWLLSIKDVIHKIKQKVVEEAEKLINTITFFLLS